MVRGLATVGCAVGARDEGHKTLGTAAGGGAAGRLGTSRGGCEMQAIRGFADKIQSRGRLIGGCVALALAACGLTLPSYAGATTPPPVTEQYLALGDSLAFGYSTQTYHEGEVAGFEDPEKFDHGYANAYLKYIKGRAVKLGKNVKLVNDGCPGETTSSLIGTNAEILGTLNAALKKSQEENKLPPVSGESACAYQAGWNALKKVGTGGPLHHPYSGSQLEDALNTIAFAQNVEHKPVTTISLNIGANDELHTLGKTEKEAKEFVEAKVAKVGKEAVEAKLAKVGEEAVKAKLAKVAAEAIEAKVNEQVFIKCSEKAFAETGGEEPAFEEARNNCLATEGKKLGEEYFAEHQAQLEKEGEEAAGKYFFEHQAQLEKEGKEAAEKYFGEHKAEVEKEGKEAAEKFFAEHKFELAAEGEKYGGELVLEKAPALFAQINSNLSGIVLALRDAHTLGLNGGKDVDYTGRIIFQGGYNPFGKLFERAFEGVQFVEEHGGLAGPFGTQPGSTNIVGRCEQRQLTEAAEVKKIEEGCFASLVHPGFTSLVETLNGFENQTVHGGYGACMTFPVKTWNPGSEKVEPEHLKAWTNMANGSQTNGKYNGPDIHPTSAGYTQLAKEMKTATFGKCHKEGLPGF
jgi:hypothetical protein